MSIVLRAALIGLATMLPMRAAAWAEDAWNPFEEKEIRERTGATRERAERPLPRIEADGADRAPLQSLDAAATPVERGELPPVLVGDGSGLPLELWQGLDVPAIEEHVARIETPPRSLALRALWARLWTTTASPPGGAQVASHFLALRLEALYRAGLMDALSRVLAKQNDAEAPLVVALRTRAQIGLGDRQGGCSRTRALLRRTNDMPKPLGIEVLLMSGYCAAAEGNIAAAGLAADLLHEQHASASPGLAALDALATGAKVPPEPAGRISLLDYRLLQLAGAADSKRLLPMADAALLVALANDKAVEPSVRVAAGEAASRLTAMAPGTLADVYRAAVGGYQAPAHAGHGRGSPELTRALKLAEAQSERAPAARARLLQDLVEDARRHDLHMPIAAIVGHSLDDLLPRPDLDWFAETAIEASLAAERYEQARRWIAIGGSPHWRALAAIAAPDQASLESLSELAAGGRLPPIFLHRLATVLDALDFQVPLDLWEAANRTPQPADGHLPETGILSQLQDAARKKELARTALLAMRTVGPDGAEGAHMIALGDAIKALKRAGLESEARRLGFEALFAAWPRAASH
jgi:hypothetical protein